MYKCSIAKLHSLGLKCTHTSLYLRAERCFSDDDWTRVIQGSHSSLWTWFFVKLTSQQELDQAVGLLEAGVWDWLWPLVKKRSPFINLNLAARHTLTQQGGQYFDTTQCSASRKSGQLNMQKHTFPVEIEKKNVNVIEVIYKSHVCMISRWEWGGVCDRPDVVRCVRLKKYWHLSGTII